LLTEGWADSNARIPEDAASKRHLLRTLMNLRPPLPARPELIELQDRFFTVERALSDITDPYRLPAIWETFGNVNVPFQNQLALWKGDITALAADAIVNAANSKLLGCFIPHHRCIDNAIHSSAGIQLRLECHEIMNRQEIDEPVGQSKITRGYNLPAKYVLHTVGPTIYGEVSAHDKAQLASCYTACLDQVVKCKDIQTIAFCCISTGEFRFPKNLAAQIAVNTVSHWLKKSNHQLDRVIFNTFTQEDYDLYANLFRQDWCGGTFTQ